MDMMNISIRCPQCQKDFVITVPTEGYRKWSEDGVLIQIAMPKVAASDREMLLTGICAADWEKLFPDDEELEEWDYESDGYTDI